MEMVKETELVEIETVRKKEGLERQLYLSSIETYYLFEHLRGWSHDVYLEFHPDGKLKQVHSTGKRIEERAKQLGLSYDGMVKIDAKLGGSLFSAISKNRADSCGTEIEIKLDDKGEIDIDKLNVKPVKSFDF